MQKKRSIENLQHYRLHDQDRPVGEQIIIMTFETLEELQYHYEYKMKKTEVRDLFIMEEQKNDKSNPGRLVKIFCLVR